MRKSVQIFVLLLVVTAAFAQVPRQISFQARLTTPDGVPYHDVVMEVTFRIYNSPTSLVELWDETHPSIDFENGVCSVILGDFSPLYMNFDTTYWLEIEIDGEVLSPRYQMTSSPYAIRAAIADTAEVAVLAGNADVAVFAATAGYSDYSGDADYAVVAGSASFADSAGRAYTADAVAWDDITGMPAGFADGVDNTGSGGGSYTAGVGIDIDSDVISIADGGVTLAKLNDMGATDGQILKYESGIGWTVAADETGSGGATYTAGEGISITDVEISIASGGIVEEHIADGAVSLDKISSSGSSPGQVIKNVGGTLMWAEDSEGSGTGTGDDWGDDVVISDASLTGNGTADMPLQVAPDGIGSYHIANHSVGYPHLMDAAVHLENIDVSAGSPGQVLKIHGGNAAWRDDSTYADGWGMDFVHVDGYGLLGNGTSGSPLYIGNYTLQPVQIDPSDASPGQVLKYDSGLGSVVWADDETSSGGSTDDDWTIGGSSIYSMADVGIGIEPAENLHIFNDSETRVLIESGSHATLYLDAPLTNNGRITFLTSGSRNGSIEWNGPSNGLAFYHGPVSATPDMFLADPGWLGIGTDAPTQPLHVAGNVHIEGNLTVDGSYPGGGGGGVSGSGEAGYLARWDGSSALNASSVETNADGSIELNAATDGGYVARFVNTATGIKSGLYAAGTGGIGVYGATASDASYYAGVTGKSSGNAPGLRGEAGTGLAAKLVGDVEVDDDLYVDGDITTGNHTSPAVPIAFGVIDDDGTIINATSNVIAAVYDTMGYEVTIEGESIHYADYVIIGSVLSGSELIITCSSRDGHAYFQIHNPESHIIWGSKFSFVIYKI